VSSNAFWWFGTIDKELQQMSANSKRLWLVKLHDKCAPFELHIPRYQFCGPGTRLEERLARDNWGINPLNVACHKYDIAYSHSLATFSQNGTWSTIYSPRKCGNALSQEIRLSEKELLRQLFGQLWKLKRKRRAWKRRKENEQTNTPGSKTRRYPANPAVVGGSRFIDRRSGGNRESGEW